MRSYQYIPTSERVARISEWVMTILLSGNRTDMDKYSKLNDNELIIMAQNGDDVALETILVRYKPLVYKKSQPYYLAGGDDDDVIQEGLIGLYKAIMSFDKEKFPLFNVFAGVCIERRIISAVKKAKRLKHDPLNTYVSLDGDDKDENVIEIVESEIAKNPEKIFIENEDVTGLEIKINNALSSFEMQVLLCQLNGHTYRETADILNRDVKAVDNAMQRIKKKLEDIVQ